MELWLLDPVTRAYLDAVRRDDDFICQQILGGNIGHPESADLTQAAYFENLGLRTAYGRCSNPVGMIERWFDIAQEEGENND